MTAEKYIAIASDHAGTELKSVLKDLCAELSWQVRDLGTGGSASVDYPDFAHAVAVAVQAGKVRFGVLICGSGIGMSIAANRHKNIRAALCHDGLSARFSRLHNDANILCLGARLIGVETAKDALHAFLGTAFEGGRHAKRVEKIEL